MTAFTDAVRLLAGDIDETHLLTDAQVLAIARPLVKVNDGGDMVVNVVDVSTRMCRLLSTYMPDQRPLFVDRMDKRAGELENILRADGAAAHTVTVADNVSLDPVDQNAIALIVAGLLGFSVGPGTDVSTGTQYPLRLSIDGGAAMAFGSFVVPLGAGGTGSVLPDGSDARRELRWDTTAAAWEAVSNVTTTYYGAVVSHDFGGVATALALGLNTAGSRINTDTYILRKNFGENNIEQSAMQALWAGLGVAPTLFVLSVAHRDWIENFNIRVGQFSGGHHTIPSDVIEDFVYINGTGYHFRYAVYPGVEADAGYSSFIYTSPPVVYSISETP